MIHPLRLLRRRKEGKAAANAQVELREFLYLDEVSITSLLSSRRGAIPSEFTDTLTDSTRAELNSDFSAGIAPLKSKVGSRLEATQTQNRQVLRKATIQATFKELYESERASLTLRTLGRTDVVPSPEDVKRQIKVTSSVCEADPKPWIVGSSTLKRGELAEVEVELEADPLFRLSTICSSMVEILAESKSLGAQIDLTEIEGAMESNRLLERLMVGLVPLRSRLVDYISLASEDGELLIHRKALDQIPLEERPSTTTVFLSGVVEQDLFWKDIRRILFSRAQVRVLCRLNQTGISESWTPVKLFDVLGEVAPDLAPVVRNFESEALRRMTNSRSTQTAVAAPQSLALMSYGASLAKRYDLFLSGDDILRLELLAAENANLVASGKKREAYEAITEFIESRLDRPVDRDETVRLRGKIGLDLLTQPLHRATFAEGDSGKFEDRRFLEAEVIAIYW